MKLSRLNTSVFVSFTLGLGLFIIISRRMIDGAGYCVVTVLIYPRPLSTKDALSEKMSIKARFVLQTLSGS